MRNKPYLLLGIGLWTLATVLIFILNPIPLSTQPGDSVWAKGLDLGRFHLKGSSKKLSKREGLGAVANWNFSGKVRLKEDLFVLVDTDENVRKVTGLTLSDFWTSETLRQITHLDIEALPTEKNPWSKPLIFQVGKKGEEYPLEFQASASRSNRTDQWNPYSHELTMGLRLHRLDEARGRKLFPENAILVNSKKGEDELRRMAEAYATWREGVERSMQSHKTSVDQAIQDLRSARDEAEFEFQRRLFVGALLLGQVDEPKADIPLLSDLLYVDASVPQQATSSLKSVGLHATSQQQSILLSWDGLVALQKHLGELEAYRKSLEEQITQAKTKPGTGKTQPLSTPSLKIPKNLNESSFPVSLIMADQKPVPLLLDSEGNLVFASNQQVAWSRMGKSKWATFSQDRRQILYLRYAQAKVQVAEAEGQLDQALQRVQDQRESELSHLNISELFGTLPAPNGSTQTVRIVPRSIKDGTHEVALYYQAQPDLEEIARIRLADSDTVTKLVKEQQKIAETLVRAKEVEATLEAASKTFDALAFREAPARKIVEPTDSSILPVPEEPALPESSFASIEFPQRQASRSRNELVTYELFLSEDSWISPQHNVQLQKLQPEQIEDQVRVLTQQADSLLQGKYYGLGQDTILRFERATPGTGQSLIRFSFYRGTNFSNTGTGEAVLTAWPGANQSWELVLHAYLLDARQARPSKPNFSFALDPQGNWKSVGGSSSLSLNLLSPAMTEMLDSKPNGVYLLRGGQWIHLPHLGDPLKTPPSGLLRSTRSFFNKPEVFATIPRGEITLYIKGSTPGSFKINQLNEDGDGGVQLFEGDTIKAEGKVESIAQGLSLLRLTSPSMPDGYVQVQLIGPNRGPVSYHLLRLKR